MNANSRPPPEGDAASAATVPEADPRRHCDHSSVVGPGSPEMPGAPAVCPEDPLRLSLYRVFHTRTHRPRRSRSKGGLPCLNDTPPLSVRDGDPGEGLFSRRPTTCEQESFDRGTPRILREGSPILDLTATCETKEPRAPPHGEALPAAIVTPKIRRLQYYQSRLESSKGPESSSSLSSK